jgi:hypothetical protein
MCNTVVHGIRTRALTSYPKNHCITHTYLLTRALTSYPMNNCITHTYLLTRVLTSYPMNHCITHTCSFNAWRCNKIKIYIYIKQYYHVHINYIMFLPLSFWLFCYEDSTCNYRIYFLEETRALKEKHRPVTSH